jgi:hypothetical protein
MPSGTDTTSSFNIARKSWDQGLNAERTKLNTLIFYIKKSISVKIRKHF